MMPDPNMPNTDTTPLTPPMPPLPPVAPAPISSAHLGKLLRSYMGNPFRFIGIGLWAGISVFGIFASIGEKSGVGILFWLASGAGCYAYYYYVQRDIHAEIYEQGFSLSRGGKTLRGRWSDIRQVDHWVKQMYMYGFIPMGSKNHSFVVVLRDGSRMKITASFSQGAKGEAHPS
jgi:uncharacterized protein DUF6585